MASYIGFWYAGSLSGKYERTANFLPEALTYDNLSSKLMTACQARRCPMPSATFYNLPAEKRERLLRAAREEFSRVPYESASVNRIIQSAGIPIVFLTDKQGGSRCPENWQDRIILSLILFNHSHYTPTTERIAVLIYKSSGCSGIFKILFLPLANRQLPPDGHQDRRSSVQANVRSPQHQNSEVPHTPLLPAAKPGYIHLRIHDSDPAQ